MVIDGHMNVIEFVNKTVLICNIFFQVQRKRNSLYKELVVALIEESIAEFTENGRLGTCLLPLQIRDVLNSLACHGKENSIYYFFPFNHSSVQL